WARMCCRRKVTSALAAPFPFGPRGSTVSGRHCQRTVTLVLGLLSPVAQTASCFFSSAMGYRASQPRCTLTDPNVVHSVQGPAGAPLPSATAALTHSTHAPSAWAVADEVMKPNATSRKLHRAE